MVQHRAQLFFGIVDDVTYKKYDIRVMSESETSACDQRRG